MAKTSSSGTAITYPLNPAALLRKRNAIKRELNANASTFLPVRIAVLGGTTTSEVTANLEVLLLNRGIQPCFFESQYNRFYEVATVDAKALHAFHPEVIYICTSWRNISFLPPILASQQEVDARRHAELNRYRQVWTSLLDKLPGCTILQNNFEPCSLRPLGNMEAAAEYASGLFVHRLNLAFANEARVTPQLKIVDVHGLAERLGTLRWSSPQYWFGYKMAQSPEAALYLANAVSALVAAIYGKSKKCLVLDLDNTVWGGSIGDDGPERLKLGRETPLAEAYTAFQEYCHSLLERGVLLAVASKNDDTLARQGFAHPASTLRISDFSAFHANWAPKDANIRKIAEQLNIGLDSLVFADDNPAERALVRGQLPSVAVLELGTDVTRYAEIIEESGYFETGGLSADDTVRVAQYADNQARMQMRQTFQDYGEYLASLDMVAEIRQFSPVYMERIAQLTNKTNQFNLTTRRYTQSQIEILAARADCLTLYGRLCDRFGDNGLVSLIIGIITGTTLEVDLWLMSCRVLKRDLELAMLDELAAQAESKGVTTLVGRYIRTAKNDLVADHYEKLGFKLLSCASDGSSSVWELSIGNRRYRQRNQFIRLIRGSS